MIIPSNHLFKYIPGVVFDFRFQYIAGPAGSTNPVNLTNYSGQWIVTDSNGAHTYGMGVPGHTGVFFGGDTADPTNGIIDLIMIANDTTALSTPASYQFTLTPNGGNVVPLLFGGMVNIDTNLWIGQQPPFGVIDGGTASSNFSEGISGGGA